MFQSQLYSELAYVLLSHIDSRLFSSRYFSFLAFIYSLHYIHMTCSMLISNIICDWSHRYTLLARLKVRSIFIKNIEHERTSLIICINLEKFEALSFQNYHVEHFSFITSVQRYWSSSSWKEWARWDCWSNDFLTVATDYKIISKWSNALS